MPRPRVCILDIDGTLIDAERRFQLGQKKRGGTGVDWEFVLNPDVVAALDKPMPSEIISRIRQLCAELNCEKIVILTGRPERLRDVTVRQLREVGFPEDYILIMRREGDYRKEVDFKLAVLHELAREYEVVAFFDDNLEVLKCVKNVFPWIRTFHVSKQQGVREIEQPAVDILSFLQD